MLLRRYTDDMKCKKSYKSVVFTENVLPVKLVKALHYLLKNSEILQNENIHVDYLLLKKITTSAESEMC